MNELFTGSGIAINLQNFTSYSFYYQQRMFSLRLLKQNAHIVESLFPGQSYSMWHKIVIFQRHFVSKHLIPFGKET